jgi:predicted kinase
MKAVITVGLPSSGKTTWAKGYCQTNLDWCRVSRDDIRNMLGKYWMPSREKLVTKIQVSILEELIEAGKNIIIDDTNLNPKTLDMWQTMFYENKIQYQIKSFTDVSLDECIKRDLVRPNSVGEKVIRDMHKKYLQEKQDIYVQNEDLPRAMIVDLDGTLALFGSKNPYDRDFENDKVNVAVLKVIENYINGIDKGTIIIFSGRSDKYFDVTRTWLEKTAIYPRVIKMRKEGDTRKDCIIKKEMFDKYVKDQYYIDFVLDDRNQVVELWRSLGLTCFQVNDGDF